MSDENIMTDITVADVQLMLQIIEVVSSRGAFKPAEFMTVGNLTQKLHAVLQSVQKKAEDTPQTQPSETVEPKQLELPFE